MWARAVTVGLCSICFATSHADEFASGRVQQISIATTESSSISLKRQPHDFAPVDVQWGLKSLTSIGLHLKGMGAFLPLDRKPSLVLKFNKYVRGQKVSGRSKVMLNTCLHDPTFVSEVLCARLFQDAGLPAPKATFAHVHFNGRDLGIYALVEGVNEPFLEREFGDGSGNLYEGVVQDLSDGLDQDNGRTTDQSDLRKVAEASRLSDPTERLRALEKIVDVPAFLRFTAMEMLVGHWDGYAMHQSNYRIYHNPRSGKMTMIPHGMDQTFRDPEASIWPSTNSILLRALLTTEQGRAGYAAAQLNDLTSTVFMETNVFRHLDQSAAVLRAELKAWNTNAVAEWETALAALRHRITRRLTSIRQQLARRQSADPDGSIDNP